jgi:hypothetical protein
MLHRNFKHDHFSSLLKGTVYSIVSRVGTTLPPLCFLRILIATISPSCLKEQSSALFPGRSNITSIMLHRNVKHDHFSSLLKGTVYSIVSTVGATLPPLCSTGILNTTISPPCLKEQSTVLFRVGTTLPPLCFLRILITTISPSRLKEQSLALFLGRSNITSILLHRNFKHDHFSSLLKGTVYSIVSTVRTTLPSLCSTGILSTTISPFILKKQSIVLFLQSEQHYLHYAPQVF